MKLGSSKSLILLIIHLIFLNFYLYADDRILSAPLINLNELKPSFEDIDNSENDVINNEVLKKKKEDSLKNNSQSATLIGLDKITAKTSEINISLGETKKFGPLEIKVLKCGKTNSNNLENSVAYMQVKDLTENENEKVFIFNGWTFSSDPTIAPFDHAIYDLQLVNCNNT
tara:strand:+ start:2045 stop:2557 length:513 start_codon:yes stop_codon:yes gene_type:complete